MKPYHFTNGGFDLDKGFKAHCKVRQRAVSVLDRSQNPGPLSLTRPLIKCAACDV